MSWEDMGKRVYRAPCACGQGYVEHSFHLYGDDWNRIEERQVSYEIQCDFCKVSYHIENNYLVPIGLTLNYSMQNHDFQFRFDEWLIATFSVSELKEIYQDMKTNKFSTRLTKSNSKYVVKQCKSRNLKKIIPDLEKSIEHYNSYFWNKERLQQFKSREQSTNKVISEIREVVRKQSHFLEFTFYTSKLDE